MKGTSVQDLIDRINTFMGEDRNEQAYLLEMKESMYYVFKGDVHTHLAMTFWNWIYDNV